MHARSLALFALAAAPSLVVGCHRHHVGVHVHERARSAPSLSVSTRLEPVVDDYFGAKVVDPYRWLEDGNAPDVKAWSAAQDRRTRAFLASNPLRNRLRKRLDELLTTGSIGASEVRPGLGKEGRRYFFVKREAHQSQPILYWRDDAHGADHALIDPASGTDPSGARSLDWWYPSVDGALVAYGTSAGGDEMSTLRVRDVVSGVDGDDVIPRTMLASVAWTPSSSGFFYTRLPAKGQVHDGEERYHRAVYFHRLHTHVEKDRLVWPTPDLKRPMTDFPSVDVTPSGRFVVIRSSQGHARTSLFLQEIRPDGEALDKAPMQSIVDALTMNRDATYDPIVHRRTPANGGPDEDVVFIHTNEDAPNFRVMAFDPREPKREGWREVVAQGQDPIRDVDAVGDMLFLSFLHRAHVRLEMRSIEGIPKGEIELPPLSSASLPHGMVDGKEAIFTVESYVEPPTLRRLDLARPKETDVLAAVTTTIPTRDYEVEQIDATSRDGTIVTAFIVHKRSLKKSGDNPTLLYGYGGFSRSQVPTFGGSIFALLERGGVFVVANLRGGAEYGEAWHHAAMRDQKQHSFDDAIAIAERVIADGWTRSDKLAVMGASNGGLLVGALITQRPDLFRAGVAQVPLADMLRYDQFLVGKLWVPEYGTAKEAADFPFLYAYSPFHHVVDGTKYPAVLITAGEGDARVDPLHARKLAARLQHATSSDRPVLLRVEPKAGHGAGKPRELQLEELADVYTFLLSQLGVRD
ncbi:MAG: prolyl oligopeptidase family protein [Polyangiales bacterium]